MKVILGTDKDGHAMKDMIKQFLKEKDFEVVDVTEAGANDFIDATAAVVKEIREDEHTLGILFDAYGAGSFITATKHQGIVAAEVSDERSAYMTREHNNARIITLGSEIVGNELARNIVLAFLTAHYDGGRHQIRVDMLNKMF